MNPNSKGKDEPTFFMLMDETNENYEELWENDVNDLVPMLQNLHIDDESINSQSETVNTSNYFSVDVTSSLPSCSQEVLTSDLAERLSPTPGHEATSIHSVNQGEGQNLEQSIQMKELEKENTLNEQPLNLCLRNQTCTVLSRPAEPVNERGFTPIKDDTEKIKLFDPETGELFDDSNIIPQEGQGSDEIADISEHHADKMQKDESYIFDSPKLSYSAGESSYEESRKSSGIPIDSSLDSRKMSPVSVKSIRTRKNVVLDPPDSDGNEKRRRRSDITQSSSSDISETKTSKSNYSSEEELKMLSSNESATNTISRRRYRKTIKSSPRVKKTLDEEKRSTPCKRKKSSSENSIDVAGKFRRRSISEHKSDTTEQCHLAIRSRSLSPGHRTSFTNPSTDISQRRQSRKRTNPDIQNRSRVKSRRPSNSPDIENQSD